MTEPAAAPATKAPRAKKEKVRKPRPPRTKPQGVTTATVIAIGLMGLTGLIALFGLYLFVGSGLAANRTQDVLYSQLEESLAQATVPVAGVIPVGTPLGIVEIPRLGTEQVFVEGSASEQTIGGPGLKPDSVLPGQKGVSVLVGRRAAFGAPWRDLDQLRLGDRIVVTTGQGEFTYVVDLVRTTDAAAEIESVPARLTLVTSDPAYTPNRSLQVSAQLDGDPQPTSTGSTASPDDVPGAGSSGRGIALLLWSQLLLLVVGLVTWAALRFNVRAVWIGAVPVLLAILWNVFENLAVLLPNTSVKGQSMTVTDDATRTLPTVSTRTTRSPGRRGHQRLVRRPPGLGGRRPGDGRRRGDRADRPLRLRQVHVPAHPQPDARAGAGREPGRAGAASTVRTSTTRPCARSRAGAGSAWSSRRPTRSRRCRSTTTCWPASS